MLEIHDFQPSQRHTNPSVLSTPAQLPPEPARHPEELSRHIYCRGGEPVMLVLRLSHDEEQRYYRDLRKGGDRWLSKKPDCFDPPHYNHDALVDEARRDEPIFYVETEIQADALIEHGILATTFGSPGAFPSYETWVLKGRDVIALGSNSEIGSQQAFNIVCQYGHITGFIASHTISSPVSKMTPAGYTILDWLRDIGPVPDLKNYFISIHYGNAPNVPKDVESQAVSILPAPKYQFLVQKPHRGMAKPKQRWILDGVLPATGTAMLYGEGGVGKSFVASEIAFAVQNGRDFGGSATTQGEVIYFAVEDGDGLMRRTLESMERDPDLMPYGLVSRELDLSGRSRDPDLLIDDLLEQFSGGQIRLIIIDTLQMALGNAEESAATDATAIMRNCNRISERLGCLVLLIHHTGKEASRGHRGSSAFHGAATTMIKMDGNSSAAAVTIEKQKHGPRGLRLDLHLEAGDDGQACHVVVDSDWSLGWSTAKSRNAEKSVLETEILGILEENHANTGSPIMLRSQLRQLVRSLPCLAGKGEEAVKSQLNRTIDALHRRGEISPTRATVTLIDTSTGEDVN